MRGEYWGRGQEQNMPKYRDIGQVDLLIILDSDLLVDITVCLCAQVHSFYSRVSVVK